jgi:hypothetical protein
MTAYTVGGPVPGLAAWPVETFPEWSATLPARSAVTEDALRQQAAALLQHVYRWLDAAIPVAPQLVAVVPMLVTAVHLYQAREYPACLNQVQVAIGALQQARATVPGLPPL